MSDDDRCEEGWVYLLRVENTDLYKIGHTSRSPQKRISELEADTGCPGDLEICRTVWVYYHKSLERRLQAMYSDCNTAGEWFRLGDQQVEDVKRLLADYLRTDQCMAATEGLRHLGSAFSRVEQELGRKLSMAFNRAVHSEDQKAKALLWHLLEWFDSENEDLSPFEDEVEEQILNVLR